MSDGTQNAVLPNLGTSNSNTLNTVDKPVESTLRSLQDPCKESECEILQRCELTKEDHILTPDKRTTPCEAVADEIEKPSQILSNHYGIEETENYVHEQSKEPQLPNQGECEVDELPENITHSEQNISVDQRDEPAISERNVSSDFNLAGVGNSSGQSAFSDSTRTSPSNQCDQEAKVGEASVQKTLNPSVDSQIAEEHTSSNVFQNPVEINRDPKSNQSPALPDLISSKVANSNSRTHESSESPLDSLKSFVRGESPDINERGCGSDHDESQQNDPSLKGNVSPAAESEVDHQPSEHVTLEGNKEVGVDNGNENGDGQDKEQEKDSSTRDSSMMEGSQQVAQGSENNDPHVDDIMQQTSDIDNCSIREEPVAKNCEVNEIESAKSAPLTVGTVNNVEDEVPANDSGSEESVFSDPKPLTPLETSNPSRTEPPCSDDTTERDETDDPLSFLANSQNKDDNNHKANDDSVSEDVECYMIRNPRIKKEYTAKDKEYGVQNKPITIAPVSYASSAQPPLARGTSNMVSVNMSNMVRVNMSNTSSNLIRNIQPYQPVPGTRSTSPFVRLVYQNPTSLGTVTSRASPALPRMILPSSTVRMIYSPAPGAGILRPGSYTIVNGNTLVNSNALDTNKVVRMQQAKKKKVPTATLR